MKKLLLTTFFLFLVSVYYIISPQGICAQSYSCDWVLNYWGTEFVCILSGHSCDNISCTDCGQFTSLGQAACENASHACDCPTATPTPMYGSYGCDWTVNYEGEFECVLEDYECDNISCTDCGQFTSLGQAACENASHACDCSAVTPTPEPPTTTQDCQDACTDSSHPLGRCTAGNPDSEFCREPPYPNEWLDCDVDGVLWDCFCCAEPIPTIVPREGFSPRCNPDTRDVCNEDYRAANPNWESICTGVYSAVGCIPLGDTNDMLAFLLRWGIGIGGGVAFLLIIFAGFQIITSAGDPQKLLRGKELLTASIAGILAIIFSVFLLELIGVRILHLPGF